MTYADMRHCHSQNGSAHGPRFLVQFLKTKKKTPLLRLLPRPPHRLLPALVRTSQRPHGFPSLRVRLEVLQDFPGRAPAASSWTERALLAAERTVQQSRQVLGRPAGLRRRQVALLADELTVHRRRQVPGHAAWPQRQ